MSASAPRAGIKSLSVIDITGNPGGGMRFVRALLPALQRVRPTLRMTFFGAGASLGPNGISSELESAGINVVESEWLPDKPWKARPLRQRLAFKVRASSTRRGTPSAHYVYGRFLGEIG